VNYLLRCKLPFFINLPPTKALAEYRLVDRLDFRVVDDLFVALRRSTNSDAFLSSILLQRCIHVVVYQDSMGSTNYFINISVDA
jgi:hypothetical protein